MHSAEINYLSHSNFSDILGEETEFPGSKNDLLCHGTSDLKFVFLGRIEQRTPTKWFTTRTKGEGEKHHRM